MQHVSSDCRLPAGLPVSYGQICIAFYVPRTTSSWSGLLDRSLKIVPPRVVLRRAPRMYVVYTTQALPSPRDCRPNRHCGRSKELPEQLHNEPEMAHWGCLYQGQCAAQCLASSFAMGPALEVERVPWPAGAVRGVEWPSQTTRLCISYPPQGGGFMQSRIWTRN